MLGLLRMSASLLEFFRNASLEFCHWERVARIYYLAFVFLFPNPNIFLRYESISPVICGYPTAATSPSMVRDRILSVCTPLLLEISCELSLTCRKRWRGLSSI
jgi:hypothetical protein